jgi:4'-phosphopantetheinyl transferase EntD
MTDTDPALARAISSLSPNGLLIGHRLISPGDEFALLEEERASMMSRPIPRQRASGAARIVARHLLAQLGVAPGPLPASPSGAPMWPEGISGSLAHDDRVAIAVVGLRRHAPSVGIDIEPAAPLAPELLDLVATPQEQRRIADDPCRGRLLFAAKEAVYKAVHPLDQVFLEYHDIEVDLANRRAAVSNGRIVELRFCVSSHLVALARV